MNIRNLLKHHKPQKFSCLPIAQRVDQPLHAHANAEHKVCFLQRDTCRLLCGEERGCMWWMMYCLCWRNQSSTISTSAEQSFCPRCLRLVTCVRALLNQSITDENHPSFTCLGLSDQLISLCSSPPAKKPRLATLGSCLMKAAAEAMVFFGLLPFNY